MQDTEPLPLGTGIMGEAQMSSLPTTWGTTTTRSWGELGVELRPPPIHMLMS